VRSKNFVEVAIGLRSRFCFCCRCCLGWLFAGRVVLACAVGFFVLGLVPAVATGFLRLTSNLPSPENDAHCEEAPRMFQKLDLG
jgi:hypothetical protein